ncbi:MAG: Crp/Fnr family transcriptional regulator [Bacteroidales bacterium]|nr:Crp/Fnr family transcriptional regulator [Bacteroidales bacterium]
MKRKKNTPSLEESSLQMHPIFLHLSQEEMELINYEKECNYFKRGEILYHEGRRMTGFYCVNKGIVKIYKTGIDGKEQIIAFAQKGDILGYRSILSNENACTTSKVIEDAVLCFIPAHLLLDLIKNNSEFSFGVMKLTCHELGEANSYITDLAQKTVRERLAEILVLLKDKFDLASDGTLQISLTREELANIVGTATESVIRLLSEFKADDLIDLNGRKIKILDIQGLTKLGNL